VTGGWECASGGRRTLCGSWMRSVSSPVPAGSCVRLRTVARCRRMEELGRREALLFREGVRAQRSPAHSPAAGAAAPRRQSAAWPQGRQRRSDQGGARLISHGCRYGRSPEADRARLLSLDDVDRELRLLRQAMVPAARLATARGQASNLVDEHDGQVLLVTTRLRDSEVQSFDEPARPSPRGPPRAARRRRGAACRGGDLSGQQRVEAAPRGEARSSALSQSS
jgi:hypothetical protein